MKKKPALIIVGALVFYLVALFVYKQLQPSGVVATRENLGTRLITFPDKILITETQIPQLKAIDDKYAAKIIELREILRNIITPKQLAARAAEVEKLKKANVERGPEVTKAIEKAMGLTAEQKEKQAKTQAELRALQEQLQKEILNVLTEAQKNALRGR